MGTLKKVLRMFDRELRVKISDIIIYTAASIFAAFMFFNSSDDKIMIIIGALAIIAVILRYP